jgi:hypothetical protein
MFAKIYDTIYDGSLRADWRALVTFQQLLILCDAEGFVNKTEEAIHHRTGIPLEIIQHGLNVLSSPDPASRSRQEGGRRLLLINPEVNWGWRIVNHAAYRAIKTTEELRDYWSGKQRESRANLAERTTKMKALVGAFYKRKPDDHWSYLEQTMLAEVARRAKAMEEFEEIKALRRRDEKYFPKSLPKFLEGWNGLLDRARNGAVTHRGPNI